ncbi:MAG: hypothetical protein V4679_06135 [Pseudomonadota bacterium]
MPFEAAMAIPTSMKMEEKTGLRKFWAMDIPRRARSEIENGGMENPTGVHQKIER